MMVLFARQDQANRRRSLQDTSRALALAIDQEIESSITNLEALATSEALDAGAVKVFRAAAARILGTQKSWQRLTLFDPKGQAVLTIAKPLVDDSREISRENLDAVIATRLPVISDSPSPETGNKAINIHVPVVRERTIIYIVTAAIEPRVFTEIVARQKVAEEWRVTLFDSQRVIITRSHEANKFVGQPVGPLLAKTNAHANEQFLSGVTDDGVNAHAAISRLKRAGWFVALAVPNSEMNAILYASVATMGVGGLLLLLFGVGVATMFARQAGRSIASLSTAVHALARGQSLGFPATSPMTELVELAREMERAGQLLQERGSDRDRVETELRKQEVHLQRLADMLNLANEAIFARELDGRIIYWNRGAEQLYGYSADQAIGFLSQDLLATEFPSGREHFEAALIDTGSWSGELKQRTKAGRRIEVETRFKLIDDRGVSRIILECNRDITHRQQTVRRLSTEHAVTQALAESETPQAAWRDILEVMGEGFDWELGALWIVNKQSQSIECMETWHSPSKDFSGGAARPALSRGTGLPGRVWASEEPIWIANLADENPASKLSVPAAENLHGAFAFPIKTRNEILGVVELFSTTIREPDADLLRTVKAIGGEIGQFVERIRAEAALRQSEEHLRNQAQELEQQLLASGRLVAVGELTASMAHEFNNPLGIILGFAHGLLAEMDPADAHYHHVQIIVEEASRCERLVQELLEFGRPKTAEFAPTDIETIIRKTVDLVQPHAANNHVETALQIDGQLPPIHADAQQLQQVLLNLCLNAVDAMPNGGTLTVAAAVDGANQMTVTVADIGIGIEAEVLPRIFQPFFTSKKRRGLGLGLPICDRIVKSHCGRIDVSSEPGRGTTFKIHLRLNPRNDNDTD
jgi:PAS domain S-box-containing protein